jgi:hypothetical protein
MLCFIGTVQSTDASFPNAMSDVIFYPHFLGALYWCLGGFSDNEYNDIQAIALVLAVNANV